MLIPDGRDQLTDDHVPTNARVAREWPRANNAVTQHLNLSTDLNTLRLNKNELVFVSTPYTSDGFALIRTADNTRTMCPTIYLTACDKITLV